MKEYTYCVIIPVYNNVEAVGDVIDNCLKYNKNIIVIDDGSTDGTTEVILSKDVFTLKLEENQGKGAALKKGFTMAKDKGYDYAITIDADGQHYPEDIPRFIALNRKNPDKIIIGARKFTENVTRASKIGLFFSNFFYMWATLKKSLDTQSGYRLYPVDAISSLKLRSNAYDFEIEIIVKASWQRIYIEHLPIDVHYAKPEKRVSHFRTGRDGVRGFLVYFRLIVPAFFLLPFLYFKYLYKK